MNVLLIMPLLLPLLSGILLLLVQRRTVHRRLAVSCSLVQLAAALRLLASVYDGDILAVQIGNWSAPFGITLVADVFSGVMVTMGALMGLVVTVYSLSAIDRGRELFGYYSLLNLLLMGVSGSFLTGDIFNLYVWFEVMLMSSFVLMALGGERPQLEGAIKYVTLNLVASALFLAAIGILYGKMGTLNMADLSVKVEAIHDPRLMTALSMLFLVAFGIKAAIFPLFFWLPASYHTPPVAVTALFAGLLTKVGVYALIRVFTLIFTQEPDFTHTVLLVLAAFTMITGVLGAVAHYEVRRLLSFHIVSQIGYMILGLALFTPLALAGAIFFIVHNILAKTNLFLISGVAARLRRSYELKAIGGLYRTHPALAVLFLISAMSLAGIPPLSGFLGKLVLVIAAFQVGQGLLVAVALGVGLLTLYSMIKIWAEAFWKPMPGDQAPKPYAWAPGEQMTTYLPIILLAALTLGLTVFARPVFDVMMRAGEQLMDPTAYIHAVLGGTR